MKPSARSSTFFALALLILLSGCATFDRAKAPPQNDQKVSINYTAEELSGWSDLPIGAYKIPDSQMIISGHQKGGAAGLLFGVIGLAIQHSIESGNAQSSVQDIEELLKVKLTAQAQSTTRDLLTNPQLARKFTTEPNPAGPTLAVSTAVVGTYVSDTDIRFFLTLKASLTDPKSKEALWSTRYFVSTGKARPLAGEGSWSANGGEALKQSLATDLQKGIKFMLNDVSSPYPREDTKLNMVQGHFPYVRPRLQINAYLLAEDQEAIVFVPKIGDVIVFAGVNIMDKSQSTYRLANKDDPFFKVLEEKPATEVAAN